MSNIVLMEEIRRNANKLPLEKRKDFVRMVYIQFPGALDSKPSYTVVSLEKLPENMLKTLNKYIIDNISK
jgi:hypothetical protein